MRLSRPEEDGEAKEAVPEADAEAEKISFNKWEATNFGSSAQNEKFRRLMGIKTNKPPEVREKTVPRMPLKTPLKTGMFNYEKIIRMVP